MGRDTLSPGFLLDPTERTGRPASGSRNCVIRVFSWKVKTVSTWGTAVGPQGAGRWRSCPRAGCPHGDVCALGQVTGPLGLQGTWVVHTSKLWKPRQPQKFWQVAGPARRT